MNGTEPGSEVAVLSTRRRRFDELYRECHGPVLGDLLRRTESSDDAADAVAETFLIAWRRLDEVPPGPESRLWLYGVARRVLANLRRGSPGGPRWQTAYVLSWRSRPAALSHRCEMAELAAAFRRLPEDDREVLALEGWEELDRAQIAAVLGCSTPVIALWLGHESLESTAMYLHADMTIKERALERTTPLNAKLGCYRPPDHLQAFLDQL